MTGSFGASGELRGSDTAIAATSTVDHNRVRVFSGREDEGGASRIYTLRASLGRTSRSRIRLPGVGSRRWISSTLRSGLPSMASSTSPCRTPARAAGPAGTTLTAWGGVESRGGRNGGYGSRGGYREGGREGVIKLRPDMLGK